jgi:hypothetical protein
MKNKFIVLFACVFIIFTSNNYAQNKWKAEIKGGRNIIASGGLFNNWGCGWDVGVGFSYQLKPSLQIAATASYQYFPYNGGKVYYAVPAVIGINSRVEGNKSYAYEASLATRLHPSNLKFGPFIAFRSGLYYLNIGQINIKMWMEATPQHVSIYPYAGTGKAELKAFGAIGLGFNIPFASRWAMRFESGYTSTFDGRQQFIPVLSTIQYNL